MGSSYLSECLAVAAQNVHDLVGHQLLDGLACGLQILPGVKVRRMQSEVLPDGGGHGQTHKIVELGMAHVPEGRRIFSHLTVLENLKLGAYTRKDKGGVAADLRKVYDRFPRLAERKKQIAGTLSGGEQQMLAMGRALMSKPRIIVMDEPSMGLSPIFVGEIFDIIQSISSDGVTVLLVEQNAKKALSIADRGYVLETGKIVLAGEADELINDESVRRAYLGE